MVDFSVGIVGLDSMGAALARRLAQQGISNTPTDLNARLLQAHLAAGGSAPAGSPYDLAQVCNLVLVAETSDENLREAVSGSIGLAHALRPGTIIIDMSDSSPQTGAALARSLASKGVIWIEATPVGTPRDAAAGSLTLLASGPAEALETVMPVLQAVASRILRLGELGSGPLAKALVSTLGAMALAVYTEAVIVAKKLRLDPGGILGAIPLLAPEIGTPPAAVAAEVLTARYRSAVPAVRMQADIARILDAARAAATPAPHASLVMAALLSASHAPHATGDHMDLARWMAENAGVEFGEG